MRTAASDRVTASATVRSLHREHGTALIGTVAGVGAFLLFLLFAVQLTVTLYATSTTNAAGYDAARSVASANVDHRDHAAVAEAQRRAEEGFRELLGARGRTARLHWEIDGPNVVLRVVVDAPAILPSRVRDTSRMRRIERTFRVRIEEGPQ